MICVTGTEIAGVSSFCQLGGGAILKLAGAGGGGGGVRPSFNGFICIAINDILGADH